MQTKKATGMLIQNSFPPSGPALFMGGGNRITITLRGLSFRTRLWKQEEEHVEGVSKRILRIRKCHPPRATTKPGSQGE